jgi:hypothetical protein
VQGRPGWNEKLSLDRHIEGRERETRSRLFGHARWKSREARQELTLQSHSSCEVPHVICLSRKALQLQIQSAVT